MEQDKAPRKCKRQGHRHIHPGTKELNRTKPTEKGSERTFLMGVVIATKPVLQAMRTVCVCVCQPLYLKVPLLVLVSNFVFSRGLTGLFLA